MSKLIIHETDCHGCGVVYYEGKTEGYAYDDNADVRGAVQVLIDVGAIKEEDVIIIEGDEIYERLADLLEIEDAYYDKACEDMDPDYAYEEIEVEGEDEAE
jgi:NAD-dependent dihydropyrimidine dehydrogenase PreA subunit